MMYLRDGEVVPLPLHKACQIMVHVVEHHVYATFHPIHPVNCKKQDALSSPRLQLVLHLQQLKHD